MAINSLSTGWRPGVCTSSTRPTAPYAGQFIYETDTGLSYIWSGSTWAGLATTAANNLKANIASPSFTGNVTLSNGQIITPAQYTYNGDNTGGAATAFEPQTVVKPPNTYINNGSAFNTGNGRFTVPIAGYVLCSFNSLITRPNLTSHGYVHFEVDGVRKSARNHTVYDILGNYQTLNNTAIVYCPANSYVTCILGTQVGATAYGGEWGLGLTFRFLG